MRAFSRASFFLIVASLVGCGSVHGVAIRVLDSSTREPVLDSIVLVSRDANPSVVNATSAPQRQENIVSSFGEVVVIMADGFPYTISVRRDGYHFDDVVYRPWDYSVNGDVITVLGDSQSPRLPLVNGG